MGLKLENIVSKQLYAVLQKRKETQRRYKTDQETGEVMPFVFKLYGTGVMDYSVKPPKEMNRDAHFEDSMRIWDPWAKRELIIKNIIGIEQKLVEQNGQQVSVEVPTTSRIIFEGGYLNVPIDNDWLLCIAMFSHHNKSKPNSQKSRVIISDYLTWTEDNTSLYTGHQQNRASDIQLRSKAVQYAAGYSIETKREVLKEASKEDRFKNFNPDNKLSDAVELDLFTFADAYPREFLRVNVNDATKVELLIHDGLSRKIIVHDVEAAKFQSSIGDKKQLIVAYNKVTEASPEKALFAFLSDPKNSAKRSYLEKLVRPASHPYEEEEVVLDSEELKTKAA